MQLKTPETVGTNVVGVQDASRLWTWLLARQGLSEDTKFASAVDVARAALGLHAARLQSPFATVLARAEVPSAAFELFTSSVRSRLMTVRCMRKTLHVLPLPIARAAHAATVTFRRRDALRAIVNAEVSFAQVERIINEILSLLGENGPLFHRHIEHRLIGRRRTAEVVRLAVKLAWESGLLVYLNHSTGWNREDRRFGLTEVVHPNLNMDMDRETAVGELIEAYFDRYGPASMKDAMWWSGLSRSDVLNGLQTTRREIIAVRTPWTDALLYMFRDRLEEFFREKEENHERNQAAMNFLAHEDVALKAYFESRNRYLDQIPAGAAFNQIGEALPTILLGGRVVGTWKWNQKTRRVTWSSTPNCELTLVQKQIIDRAETLSETLRRGCALQTCENLFLNFIQES